MPSVLVHTPPQQKSTGGGLLGRLRQFLQKSLIDYAPTYTWSGRYTTYGTTFDYADLAGDLHLNAVVMACINWVARAFPEAPLRVMNEVGEDEPEEVKRHPLTQLVARPNPYYSGLLLWKGTLASLNLDGNAFWLCFQTPAGIPAQLWYEPHHTIRPVGVALDSPDIWQEPLSHYEVYRNGRWYRVERENVIHFRDGLDPRNTLKGLSPLASALREIYTDNEAANYTSALMKNMGVPGVVVSPSRTEDSIDDPENMAAAFKAKFTGDKRGEPFVAGLPLKVDVLSFTPEAMSLRDLRKIPEERVSALLGVPAIVAGLGAGLDRSTFANMSEAREMAYESNIVPTQRLLAAELDTQLLPQFRRPGTEYVDFDLSQVRVLQDDQNKLYDRLSRAYDSGWLMRSEARSRTNWPVEDADKAYKSGGAPQQVPPPAANTQNGNGAMPDALEVVVAGTQPKGWERANGNKDTHV